MALRPLRRMEDTAQRSPSGEPGGQRVEQPSTATEIGQLGAALNTMLDRIEDAFSGSGRPRRLRRFVADASHELRTPLTSIRGYAELYRRGADDPEHLARSMGRIEGESGRMSQLVEDLLLLARLDEGRPFDRAPVDLAELAAKAVDDARVVEDGHPLHLDAPSPVVVDGDDNRLTQVLVNLLANARRHTPAGTESPSGPPGRRRPPSSRSSTTVPASRRRRRRRCSSASTGPTRPGPGLRAAGLGLAIVDAVVRAHGGTVTVDATPGGGATSRVLLR